MSRTHKITVRVDGLEKRAITSRARLHKTTPASFLRTVGLGHNPNDPKRLGAASEAWWDTLSPARKAQVHRWLTAPGAPPAELPGQLPAFPAAD